MPTMKWRSAGWAAMAFIAALFCGANLAQLLPGVLTAIEFRASWIMAILWAVAFVAWVFAVATSERRAGQERK